MFVAFSEYLNFIYQKWPILIIDYNYNYVFTFFLHSYAIILNFSWILFQPCWNFESRGTDSNMFPTPLSVLFYEPSNSLTGPLDKNSFDPILSVIMLIYTFYAR